MLELAPGPGVITSGSLAAGRQTETGRETSRRDTSAGGRSGRPRPPWVWAPIPGAGATTTGKHGKRTLTGKRLTLTLTGPWVTARAALRGSRGRRAAAGDAQTRMTAGNEGSAWTDGPLLMTSHDARRSLTLSSERDRGSLLPFNRGGLSRLEPVRAGRVSSDRVQKVCVKNSIGLTR